MMDYIKLYTFFSINSCLCFINYIHIYNLCVYVYVLAESTGNAPDHNLDLSLGNATSKPGNNQALGNHATNAVTHDQHLPSESNWRNGGNKPKVHTSYTL